jgi:NAD(P)-dependent dehydrogenase (short-subunit alcohol dehydrogenase family)
MARRAPTLTPTLSLPEGGRGSRGTNTERFEAIAWGRKDPEQQRTLLDAIPLGRLGRPDDIGGVVAVLCSDAGGHVSGATIDVNGGLYFGP